MSDHIDTVDSAFSTSKLRRSAAFMGFSAVLVSGAVITVYNSMTPDPATVAGSDSMQLAITTLMPYMISAVIAAITAIGVMTILPVSRMEAPAREVIAQLNELGAGDLTARVRLNSDDPLREVAASFNSAAINLSSEIASWKIVNRQQWGALCRIRHAVESGDTESALSCVAEMEQNWDKIAEIEERIVS